jgi:hypothetical protein
MQNFNRSPGSLASGYISTRTRCKRRGANSVLRIAMGEWLGTEIIIIIAILDNLDI